MELTVIFRLLKEPGSAVISVLSDSVDISINLCAVKSATEPFKMHVVDLCTPPAQSPRQLTLHDPLLLPLCCTPPALNSSAPGAEVPGWALTPGEAV